MIKQFALVLVLVGMGLGCNRSSNVPGNGSWTHCEQHRVDSSGHVYVYLLPNCVPDTSHDQQQGHGFDPTQALNPLDMSTPASNSCIDTCPPGSTCVDGVCTALSDMSVSVVNDMSSQVLVDMTSPADLSTNPDLSTGCQYDGGVPPECDYNQNCTFSYGYWKQHWICNWQSLTLGTVTYTHDQLLTILNTPSSGSNDLIELAHQLIGAKMNIVKGADPSSIQSTIDAADALIGSLVIPSVGTGVLNSATAVSLATTLANYNLGFTGPGHCN